VPGSPKGRSILWGGGAPCAAAFFVNFLTTCYNKWSRKVKRPEMNVGQFLFTQQNPTHQLMDPTQPNPWMDPTHVHIWKRRSPTFRRREGDILAAAKSVVVRQNYFRSINLKLVFRSLKRRCHDNLFLSVLATKLSSGDVR